MRLKCNMQYESEFYVKKRPTGNINLKVELSSGGDLSGNILYNANDLAGEENDISGTLTLKGLNTYGILNYPFTARGGVVNTTLSNVPVGQYSLSYLLKKEQGEIYGEEAYGSGDWCNSTEKLKWRKVPAHVLEDKLFNSAGQRSDIVYVTQNKATALRAVYNTTDKVVMSDEEYCDSCGGDSAWTVQDPKWKNKRTLCIARGPKYNDNCDLERSPADFYKDCRGEPPSSKGAFGCWCTNRNDCSKAAGTVKIPEGDNYCRETRDIICCVGGGSPDSSMSQANRCCENESQCSKYGSNWICSLSAYEAKDCASKKKCVFQPSPTARPTRQPGSPGPTSSTVITPIPTIKDPQCDADGGICVARNICGYENNMKSIGAKDCKGVDVCCVHIKVGADFVPMCSRPRAIGGYSGQCKNGCLPNNEVRIGNGECSQINIKDCCVRITKITPSPTRILSRCEQEGGKCIDKTDNCPSSHPNKWSSNGCPGGAQLSACCMPNTVPTPFPCEQDYKGICIDRSESCPSNYPYKISRGCGINFSCCVKQIPSPVPTSPITDCQAARGYCVSSEIDCGTGYEPVHMAGCSPPTRVCCRPKKTRCENRFGGTYQVFGKLADSILAMNPKITIYSPDVDIYIDLNNLTRGSFGSILTKGYPGQQIRLSYWLYVQGKYVSLGSYYNNLKKITIGEACDLYLTIDIPQNLQTPTSCRITAYDDNTLCIGCNNTGESCVSEGFCCQYGPKPACELQGGKCIDKLDSCPTLFPNRRSGSGCPGGSQLSACCMPNRPTPTPNQCTRENGICIDRSESCPATHPQRQSSGCEATNLVCCKKTNLTCRESDGYCTADAKDCGEGQQGKTDPSCPKEIPICCNTKPTRCGRIFSGDYEVFGQLSDEIKTLNPKISLQVYSGNNKSSYDLNTFTKGAFKVLLNDRAYPGQKMQLSIALKFPDGDFMLQFNNNLAMENIVVGETCDLNLKIFLPSACYKKINGQSNEYETCISNVCCTTDRTRPPCGNGRNCYRPAPVGWDLECSGGDNIIHWCCPLKQKTITIGQEAKCMNEKEIDCADEKNKCYQEQGITMKSTSDYLCRSEGGWSTNLNSCTSAICCKGLNPSKFFNYECKRIRGNGNYRVAIANSHYTDKYKFQKDAKRVTDDFYKMKGLPNLDLNKVSFVSAWSESLASIQREIPNLNPEYDNNMVAYIATTCATQYVIVIDDGDGRAASYGFWIVIYSGDQRELITAHELSHSIAWLADEYVEDENVSAPPDAKPYELGINVSETYPCNKWSSKPYASQVGCYKGAWYNNWYRPWEESLMTGGSLELNPPSVEGWQIALKNYKSSETPTLNFTFNTDNTIYHQLLSLTINQDADNKLKLVKQEIQEGYPMDYALNLQDNYYIVRIVDKNNRKLFEGKIRYMDEIYTEDFSTNPPKGTYTSKLTDQLMLNLPVYKTAASILILDKTGKIKLNISASNPDSAYSLYDVQGYSSLCGNGLCDSLIGENVKTCKKDCQTADK